MCAAALDITDSKTFTILFCSSSCCK